MVAVSLPLPSRPGPLARAALRLAGACRALRAAYTGRVLEPVSDAYEPLRHHLAAHPDEEPTLTFAEIETLLGAPLPAEAWLRTWWANDPRAPQARAWLSPGFRVRWVRRRGDEAAVTFGRADTPARRLP